MIITRLRNFAKDEWLLAIAFSGLLLTSVYLRRIPAYAVSDLEILYILFVLFLVTKGLQLHGVIAYVAEKLEAGRFVAVKMVAITFFLSMLVTNDVALVSIVPLTVLLHTKNKEWLVILEALAANAGSAFSPFGNPQNLFLYWFYEVPIADFVQEIWTFSGLFFVLLAAAAWFLDRRETVRVQRQPETVKGKAYVYLVLLPVFILSVLRILPLTVGLGVILFVLLFDRAVFAVDYALLITFACFFGFTDNLRIILSGILSHPHHVFLLSAFLSQGISNVPAALLVADFTRRWRSLLWGVSVGGFGTLVASLANLIAYRIYVNHEKTRKGAFLLRFHAASIAAFLLGVSLYFLVFVAGV